MHAGDLVRTAARAHEQDRYLSALLAPASARGDLIALAATLGELGRIPITVSEPMIGEIRLQWWRDAITNARAGVASGNPVADAFTAAMRTHDLPDGLVLGMVDAQTPALYDHAHADFEGLCNTLANVEGAAFELAARVLDRRAAEGATAFLNDAGVCYGLARTAMEFGAITAQGRTHLPTTWLAERNLTLDRFQRDGGDAIASDLNRRLATEAEHRYQRLILAAKDQPRAVRAACRPLAIVPAYCMRVRRAGAMAAHAAQDVMPLTRVWRIWRGI